MLAQLLAYKQLSIEQAEEVYDRFPKNTDPWNFYYEDNGRGRICDRYQKGRADLRREAEVQQ